MTDSILLGVKQKVNIAPDNTEFDQQIIDYINMAFGTLHSLGIGPIEGFYIDDASANWEDFLFGDARLNGVKTYVAMKVRMVFDPPGTSFHIAAMQDQMKELEWRLNVVREGVVYGAPVYNNGGNTPPTSGTADGGSATDNGDIVYDGGSA